MTPGIVVCAYPYPYLYPYPFSLPCALYPYLSLTLTLILTNTIAVTTPLTLGGDIVGWDQPLEDRLRVYH